MKTTILTSILASAAAFSHSPSTRSSSPLSESKTDLEFLVGKTIPLSSTTTHSTSPTKTFGARETRPPLDGYANRKSSMDVSPCLHSWDTLFNRTLSSHGPKLWRVLSIFFSRTNKSNLLSCHNIDRYDPFVFNKNMSAEMKEKRLTAELNDGRLAQLGRFGFLCADNIPGSVPLLNDIAIHYDGNPMIPFEGQFSYFS